MLWMVLATRLNRDTFDLFLYSKYFYGVNAVTEIGAWNFKNEDFILLFVFAFAYFGLLNVFNFIVVFNETFGFIFYTNVWDFNIDVGSEMVKIGWGH